MEWDKAKNIIIVFFLLLNIMLSVLLYRDNLKYTLTSEQEKTIVNILADNNIITYSGVLAKFEPMKTLELGYTSLDEKQVKKAFLQNENAVLTASDNDGVKYISGKKSIEIFGNFVSYENADTSNYSQYDIKIAKILCDEFVSNMGDLGKGYSLDIAPYQRNDDIIVEYRQNINGFIIYKNYIRFTVSGYGISAIDYSKSLPIGFDGDAREICSSDVALFSFFQAMQRQSAEKPQRIIDKMDIVYYCEVDTEERLQATPYYRIYYTESTDNHLIKRLCIVDAYRNKWELI